MKGIPPIPFRLLFPMMILILSGSTLSAQWRLKTLAWNIESADSDVETIAQHLENLEGYDVIGLSEVDPVDAKRLVTAIGTKEGAKGSPTSNFKYVLGMTGNDLRLMIIWDDLRFELVGDEAVELNHLNSEWLGHRSPLYIQLRNRSNDQIFIYMVNHLARGDEVLRQSQAEGLLEWNRTQVLPIIAMGDYNYDYDIDEGVGNAAYDIMVASDDWKWLRPESLEKTQSSGSYNSVLDFTFVANMNEQWTGYSKIISIAQPFIDDEFESDHRPIESTFFIFPDPTTDPID